MLSENNLARIIKKLAVDAVNEADPASVVYGTVAEVDSETGKVARIDVDQQWQIDGDQIVLPSSYQERTVEKVKVKGSIIALVYAIAEKAEVEFERDEGCAEDECLVDVTIKDYLKAGDAVVMTRQQGGQKVVVQGRTGSNG